MKKRTVTKSAKAAVMQPKFRNRVVKAKKGKGSYTRKKTTGE